MQSQHIADVCAIIPSYNSSKTLGRALDSIRRQTVRPAQVVVVDDASRPAERALLAAIVAEHGIAGVTELALLDANEGPGGARNHGWSLARTQWIAFCDSDDAWHPQRLERQLEVADPSVVLVAARYDVADPEAGWHPEMLSGAPRLLAVTKRQMLLRSRFPTPSVLLRRDVDVRFTPNRRYSEDLEVWLRVICGGGKSVLVDEPLCAIFKAEYGAGGLSASYLRTTMGQYVTYWRVFRSGLLNPFEWAAAEVFAVVRAARRLVIVLARRIRPSTSNYKRAR